MRPHRVLCFAVLLAALLSGCGVRENRQINFSADGTSVGFQHGKEGVFVAAGDGGGLRKIFTPTKDTLAVSSPLFSPTDKRLIFTTAKAVNGGPGTTTVGNPSDPAGAVHVQCPVVYTCWLRGDKEGDKPEELFDAKCDHVGYVAANLAVRWHPKGDRLLFLDGENSRLGVFEFDLATKAKRPVFPHRSEAMIFDWASDNEHLVCVLGDNWKNKERAGIWIGKPGAGDWWHVPGSRALAAGELPPKIEQLRATRPVWTTGGRFAFASHEGLRGEGKHLLCTADLAKRTVTQVAATDVPFRDVHWARDGRLGVLQDKALHVVDGGKLSPAVKSPPIRQFAGWSADGQHLAYVAHDAAPLDLQKWNALLFVPDPKARDAIFVAAGSADTPGREALSGVRVTFPHFSPTENKLSFWGTFTPSHRSWLAALLGSALRPGDPAAVIDLSTGKLTWMPISPAEKAQVGHYHLLKRDYAEAWRWYEQARKGEAVADADDFSFFESYCLTKLGRPDEAKAKAKLEQSRESFRVSVNTSRILPGVRIGTRTTEEWVKQVGSPASLSGQLLRDLYQGEVFLSLGATEDGAAHFRKELEAATSDEERLSRAVLLAQMLLAQNRHREYARLLTSTLLPLTAKRYDPKKLDDLTRDFGWFQRLDDASLQQLVLVATAGVSLLPLSDREVLDGFTDEDLKKCLPLLQQLADRSTDSLTRKGAHLILFAAARRLGQDRERRKALDVLWMIDGPLPEKTFDDRARTDRVEKLGLGYMVLELVGAIDLRSR